MYLYTAELDMHRGPIRFITLFSDQEELCGRGVLKADKVRDGVEGCPWNEF